MVTKINTGRKVVIMSFITVRWRISAMQWQWS